MEIEVDWDACEANGLCEGIAPDIFQVDEDAYHFFWGFNYMLQDGWSFPLLVKDLLECYEAACNGLEHQQPSPRPVCAAARSECSFPGHWPGARL